MIVVDDNDNDNDNDNGNDNDNDNNNDNIKNKGNFVVNANWKELTTGISEQKPEGVVESENFKILRDFTVQCDRKIEVRRPGILFVGKKEREVVIIDVAILGDDRVKDKELEKLEEY